MQKKKNLEGKIECKSSSAPLDLFRINLINTIYAKCVLWTAFNTNYDSKKQQNREYYTLVKGLWRLLFLFLPISF